MPVPDNAVADVAAPQTPALPGPCTPVPLERCEAWVSAPYDGPNAANERVGDLYGLSENAAATSPDGKIVYTAGASQRGDGSLQYDMVTLAFDAGSGSRLWATQHEAPSDYPMANVQSVVAGPDAVYVTGYMLQLDVGGVGFTVAYDAETGEELWEAAFPGWANDSAISDDGSRVFVAGDDLRPDGKAVEAKLVAYDSATGVPTWTRTISNSKNRNVLAWRVESAGDRVVYAASRLQTFDPSPGKTIAIEVVTYDATGQGEGTLVSRADRPVDGVLPAGIALNASGSRAYVTHAGTVPVSGETAAFTFAVDTAHGDLLWSTYVDGTPTVGGLNSYTIPWYNHPIEIGPGGGSVVLTTFANPTFYGSPGKYVTVSLNAEHGGQQWMSRMGAASNLCWGPCGPSLSVNPKTGQVVVTAAILTVNRQKAITWGYASNGSLEWMRVSSDLPNGASVQVAPTANGQFPAIVHSPDGQRVFLAGSAWAAVVDSASSPDVVVAAFNTAA
jgi:outer membrane protein assembly factor BamB